MKKWCVILFSVLLTISMATSAAGHSGKTDANGGHKDNKNASGLGSYHYHHGYGAHLHPNGVCPYNAPVPKAIKEDPVPLAAPVKPTQAVADKKEITVTLNGARIAFDQPPLLVNDRVLVPIRAIFESLGYEVLWDDGTKTATATRDENVIMVQQDNLIIKHQNGEYRCDVPPMVVSDRTLVPVRAISECAGCDVKWDNDANTVVIVSSAN